MEVENEHAQECRGNPRSAPEFATATVQTTCKAYSWKIESTKKLIYT